MLRRARNRSHLPDIEARFVPWPSARMGKFWLREDGTRPSNSGMWPQARNGAHLRDMEAQFIPWPLAQTARRWHLQVEITDVSALVRSFCGMYLSTNL